MSERTLHKIVIFLTFVLLGVSLYLLATTKSMTNIYTAIFLRTGAVFLLASCFWKWIIRLPSWAQIGWIPIIAVIIAGKTTLLRYAIPASIVLVFLNSPLARGSYKKKDWRSLSKSFSKAVSAQSRPSLRSASSSEAEKNPGPASDPGSESSSESGSNPGSASNPEFASNPGSASNPESTSDPESESNPGSAPEPAHRPVVEILTEPEPESKPKKKGSKPLYGPNAQNTMFRALSRVAGRQVGKLMKKDEKKK